MPDYIGIDTSNYTTSVALYRSEENKIYQAKRLLPVKSGQLGLRQSDAVFHHTKQLPEMIEKLSETVGSINSVCITASAKPRNAEGSYMPCFLCGEGFARSYSALNKISLHTTSHQVGHILAALYSVDSLSLCNESFIAFHVSGGTTDCLLCTPDKDNILNIETISSSLDLKAGQAVDRIGLMLGLEFPCGAELEKLAYNSEKSFKIKPVIKDGNCCLSGLENQCRKMLEQNCSKEDIAAYCLEYITAVILSMTEYAIQKYGRLPLVFAGGVMSDKIIKNKITAVYGDAKFAEPAFSCDNASGVAIFGYLKQVKINGCTDCCSD